MKTGSVYNLASDGVACRECNSIWTSDKMLDGLCPSCWKENKLNDDDLRDEVAKAAMQALIANAETASRLTYYATVLESFNYADEFMTERARRREGR